MIKIIEKKSKKVGYRYYHNKSCGDVIVLVDSVLCEFHLRGSIPSVGSHIKIDDHVYEVLHVLHDMQNVLSNPADKYTKNIEITVRSSDGV